MLTAQMFNPAEGDSFLDILTGDLLVVIPIALGIFATLYGVRIAIKYFKGIAR